MCWPACFLFVSQGWTNHYPGHPGQEDYMSWLQFFISLFSSFFWVSKKKKKTVRFSRLAFFHHSTTTERKSLYLLLIFTKQNKSLAIITVTVSCKKKYTNLYDARRKHHSSSPNMTFLKDTTMMFYPGNFLCLWLNYLLDWNLYFYVSILLYLSS